MRRGSISSELVMSGGGMHNILLLPLVASRGFAFTTTPTIILVSSKYFHIG